MPLSIVRFASLRELVARTERTLLGSACLLCDRPVPAREEERLVCGPCISRWHRIEPPWCPRCGATVELDDPCTVCLEWPEGLLRVRSAVWLDEGARRAVHALKYSGWWRIAEALVMPMRGLIEAPSEAVYIPIPLGKRRQRRRGYNQSEALARAMTARLGGTVDTALLSRTRDTRSQTKLTPDQRAANVSGAFVSAGELPAHPVLVDDVFTTGATLVAAATALHRAGATSVRAVTFARARTTLD